MKKTILQLALLVVLNSCSKFDEPPPDEVEGFVPVYEKIDNGAELKMVEARQTNRAGKIYTRGAILYQVDNGAGIHVISIVEPDNPEKLGFIPVTGAQEISIQNNVLYTNNGNDLIAVDITAINDLKIISRINNAFSITANPTPPTSGYFECVDPSKGIVKGWRRELIYKPKCKL